MILFNNNIDKIYTGPGISVEMGSHTKYEGYSNELVKKRGGGSIFLPYPYFCQRKEKLTNFGQNSTTGSLKIKS